MSTIKNRSGNNSIFFILFLLFVLSNLNGTINADEIPVESYDSDSTNIKYANTFQLKSESHAFKESFWGTVGPLPTIAFAVPGLVFGPSLGYFYAEKPGRAWAGIGIRSIGVIVFVGAFLDETIQGDCFECYYDDDSTADIVMAVSASVVILSAVYDIATVKKAMRKKKASMLQSNLNIEPSYFADSKSYGLRLHLRF